MSRPKCVNRPAFKVLGGIITRRIILSQYNVKCDTERSEYVKCESAHDFYCAAIYFNNLYLANVKPVPVNTFRRMAK